MANENTGPYSKVLHQLNLPYVTLTALTTVFSMARYKIAMLSSCIHKCYLPAGRSVLGKLCPWSCNVLQCNKKLGKLPKLEFLKRSKPIRLKDLGFRTTKKLDKKKHIVTCIFLVFSCYKSSPKRQCNASGIFHGVLLESIVTTCTV